MDLVEPAVVCALVIRSRKRKKMRRQYWAHPIYSSRLLKGTFYNFNYVHSGPSHLSSLKSKFNQVWNKHFNLFYPDMFRSLLIIFRGLLFSKINGNVYINLDWTCFLRTFYTLYEDLREHPTKFSSYFRMSVSAFDELLTIVGSHVRYQNTKLHLSIPPEERIAVSIRQV
jgi:hypothetical protein